MSNKKPEYKAILEQNGTLSLGEIVIGKLNKSQQQQLIEDILSEEVDDLAPFLQNPSGAFGKKFQMASLFYSSADLAFNFLSEMSVAWLEEHADYMENRFEEAWGIIKEAPDNPKKEQKAKLAQEALVLDKIKTLVANTKAGFRPDFLAYFIQKYTLEIEEELEFYLLWAKIEERAKVLNIKEWSNRIHIDKKPALSALFLYILRKENPLSAIRHFLLIDSLEEKPSQQLLQFFSVYLKQTIYQLLNGAESDVYLEFLSIRESISRKWLDELFDQVMAHPALEEINKNYKKAPAILQGTSEQHKQRIKNFEDNIFGN